MTTKTKSPVNIVLTWQDAANKQQIGRLLDLSNANIEFVGARGTAHGHDTLKTWLARARLTLETRGIYTQGDAVVLAQNGVWRSPMGDITGRKSVATAYTVKDNQVVRIARFDTLKEALTDANLTEADAQPR